MSNFIEIAAEDLKENPFQMIGSDWMLITSKSEDKVNTMTASWGGVGIMWGKPVAYLVIRSTRYTKEFIDKSRTLSISILGKEHKKTLSYLGTVSGREEDKIKKSGLSVAYENEIPYFQEANTVMLCRNLFTQELSLEHLLDQEIIPKWYSDNNLHSLYIAEIEKVLTKG